MIRNLLLAATFCLPSLAAAQTVFLVDSVMDGPDAQPGDGACNATGGGCTLRAALDEVRMTPPAQGSFEVRVPPGSYVLADAAGPLQLRLPILAQQLTVTGWIGGAAVPAAQRPVIVAGPGFTRQLMAARPASGQLLRLRDLRLLGARVAAVGGVADKGGAVGCVSQQAGILDARRVEFADHRTPAVGAALYAEGCSVTLEDVALADNCGVNAAATLTSSSQPSARTMALRRVSITGNRGGCDGAVDPQFHALAVTGTLVNEQWDLRIENVTVGQNQGAIRIAAPVATPSAFRQASLRNVTLHGNEADFLGSDSLVVSGDVDLKISHSTLGETAALLRDYATVSSLGYTRGDFTLANGATHAAHATDVGPELAQTRFAPLGTTSDYTLGYELSRGSALLDAGAPASHANTLTLCATVDQGGRPRPSGLACDIGAIESGFLFGDGFE